MQFISYGRMAIDAANWAMSPDFDGVAAVVGIPRSGSLVAHVVALQRNMHLLDYQDIAARKPIKAAVIRRGERALKDGPVVVIDDTIRTGKTLHAVRAKLGRKTACGRDIRYGALYHRGGETEKVQAPDHQFRKIQRFSLYGWNWAHTKAMTKMILDLDGVLCANGLSPSKEWATARPLVVPTYPCRAIVTGRRECYRELTEAWLAQSGIKYGSLLMMPTDKDEHAKNGGVVGHKAMALKSDADAVAMIESDEWQAVEIAKKAGKPVLCTQSWKVFE
jgi:hypothetical protein